MQVLVDGAKASLTAEHQVKLHMSRLLELDIKCFACWQLFTKQKQKGLKPHGGGSLLPGNGKQASMTARH